MNCPNCTWKIYFNPLRPRGRRLASSMSFIPIASVFQPTPPARTETMTAEAGPWRTDNFNPLRPRGRRPSAVAHWLLPPGYFNPLRPRGRRLRKTPDQFTYGNFNPLRPRGRRLYELSKLYLEDIFQPTPPARTETFNAIGSPTLFAISTHSAREDGDYQYSTMEQSPDNFNPLRPRGRRL